MSRKHGVSAFALTVLWCAVMGLQACGPESQYPPTAPGDDNLLAARGGGGGGGKPTSDIKVSGLDPDTVPADTVLTIRVLGSGFTPGSAVSWARAGSPTTKVQTTGPVTFVSSKELVAPVTVTRDAPLTSYDVIVTAVGGKKGIGIEMLEVVAKLLVLPEPEWATSSEAHDVNDQGVIVGSANDNGGNLHALRWTPAGESWTVEVLGPGAAVAINDEGYVVRRWHDASAGQFHSWVVTPSGSETPMGPVYVNGIGNTGTLIGSIEASGSWSYVAWRRVSPTTWGPPVVLPARPGFRNSDLNGISDTDDIAGHLFDPAGLEWAAVWRYTGGQWNPPALADAELGGTAFAVNARGAVAGAVWPCSNGNGGVCAPSRPAYWPAVGAPRVLLADPFYDQFPLMRITASVNDMSNADQVVGWAVVSLGRRSTAQHAVLWSSPTVAEPLDLGAAQATWTSAATAINDSGIAVGYYSKLGVGRHALAWRLP